PVGPAEGLFKAEFFRHCHRALADGGVLVQQSESPLLHSDTIILDLHANMREAGFSHTRTLPFPQPVYPSGWWSCTLAGKDHDVADFRQADATGKSFETRYYSADIHKAALVLPPFMEQALS
ncbi:MAG TPA: polyamine aminopropyltransferase, partial [Alcanivorax sp.]|nr:polyamine aminopropyltransferase [Alcanivorax sp.]HCJ63001.1 polyamine aminopropyltransferase [Alcanivorax sp.]